MNQYFVRYVRGYGWWLWYGPRADGLCGLHISGFTDPADLDHVLSWCASNRVSAPVTILPAMG